MKVKELYSVLQDNPMTELYINIIDVDTGEISSSPLSDDELIIHHIELDINIFNDGVNMNIYVRR